MTSWNSSQYLKFKKERTRLAIDLAQRISVENPADILDVGCGPGNSTAVLEARYPGARILGIDSSEDMIAAAKEAHPSLEFALCDASTELEKLGRSFNVVFSNACIQWIPDHPSLLVRLMSLLNRGGILAVQIPMYHDEPIHQIIGAMVKDKKWRERFKHPRVFSSLRSNKGSSARKTRNIRRARQRLMGQDKPKGELV